MAGLRHFGVLRRSFADLRGLCSQGPVTRPASVSAALPTQQARWKPIEPIKWPNGKVVRMNIDKVCRPEEVPNDYDEVKGDFGLVAANGGVVTAKQLEAMFSLLKHKGLEKTARVEMRDEFQLFPVWWKAESQKGGKGLPEIRGYQYRIRRGTVLFDVYVHNSDFLVYEYMWRFLQAAAPLCGVRVEIQRQGIVDGLDDFDLRSAQSYMDKNWYRKHQDVFPWRAYGMHYIQFSRLRVPDHPMFGPKDKQARRHFPVFTGGKFSLYHAHYQWYNATR